ncbi:MAG: succinyl-diaminopimelate desuccinylase [Alphaproteobacteria bacterium]|nr:succinyl-diaminopimelate desuccinylase [Alphaproteobacteria bacterium]
MTYNVIDLTKKLIACPSVTPKDEGALVYLSEKLTALGFECHHLEFGEGSEKVPNLFARLGKSGPHICFAGHTDVVPPGPEERWSFGPFNPHIEDGILYGRGSSDMKGSVAAFAAAVSTFLEGHDLKGSISFLITGDEEGPSINGTIKVLEWMKENGHVPDVALVGEPTNPDHLGQEIKIGRRGSLTGRLKVSGKQGHVAYQHLADNPMPRLIKLLDVLAEEKLDDGSEFFQQSNLEITSIDVGNRAENVIPDSGRAVFNIRFNDHWNAQSLETHLRELLDKQGFEYELGFEGNAESFITMPGDWSEVVKNAVKDVTGHVPEYTTNGGTSDARFIVNYCPVVEFGGINKTIHQIDENATVQDLEDLTKIYEKILESYFLT